ncbi:PREDICTED: serine/threonine-protein kinase Nek7 [Brassica oleracea var. oleracea]|uniref:Protein kinase domain-containing protein n=1 Tax=Brassica oleracea var. oleracea TaxID=109376 RepID=A0A0D3AEB5_BRAOL|nr:PREDICTED: serine/threonine-protein kinase Nek7 [Brassica oleracea var. oleracea]
MQMDFEEEEEAHKFTPDNYLVVEQVRRGKSTSDFVVLHRIDDRKYAMKKVSLAKHTEKLKQIACQELKSLSKLSNPYIVEYEDSLIDEDNNACIFTAYCEGGNMANAIKKARGKLFPEESIFKWLAQLLLAVNYLHSNRVLHMDLTCSNIFLPKHDHVQLGNYGLAKLINPEKPASLVPGIANSMCPEVLEDEPYGYKSDIWSLGCCMYEITSHQPAFKAQDKAGLINKINRSLMSPLPIVYSSTLKQMIKLMLRKKPEHRPTACELLRNPCLQPYLLKCQNLSPMYLPVFPINSPKDKARRSSLPGKFVKEREEMEKSEVSRSLENLYPFWTKTETGSSSSSQPASSTNETDDKPETKRIDPSCDTLKVSEPISNKTKPEMAICTTEKQKEENDVPKEWENMISSGEAQLLDVDVEIVSAQEGLCFTQEAEAIPEPKDQRKLSISSSEVVAESERLPGSVGVEEAKTVKLTASEMSSVLSKLTNLGPPQSKERADALECLLEKCAGLVKQEKYEELAGLLTPFGEDGVSARDTAIWFAKTLLSSDKLN